MKISILYKFFLPITMVVLSGCSGQHSSPIVSSVPHVNTANTNTRLGTQWGENIASPTYQVNAERMTSQPIAMASIYYSAEPLTGYIPESYKVRLQNVQMNVQNENGSNIRLVTTHPDIYQLKGREGQRYQLYFYNNDSRQAYEVVTTVDGIDVLSGQRGSVQNAGYVLEPKNSLTIEGFRKSDSDVAAFRFSKPQDSYATHSVVGYVKNTGVIGVALYPVRGKAMQNCNQQAFPQDGGYAPQPCNKTE